MYIITDVVYQCIDFVLPSVFKIVCICKKDVTSLLTHWSYVFLVITYQYMDGTLALHCIDEVGDKERYKHKLKFHVFGISESVSPFCWAIQLSTIPHDA